MSKSDISFSDMLMKFKVEMCESFVATFPGMDRVGCTILSGHIVVLVCISSHTSTPYTRILQKVARYESASKNHDIIINKIATSQTGKCI